MDHVITVVLSMAQPMESPKTMVSPHSSADNQPPTNGETIITVELGERSYPIRIASDRWDTVADRILAALPDMTHAVVISDSAVTDRWTSSVVLSLRKHVRCDIFGVPAGESSKSVDQLSELWQWLHRCNTDRRSVVIAIGGGVVGDLAGFAAASYARGIRLVQVPTTLLSQVDSSVGGKTGINLPSGKNMVGAFWQPELVLIDTATLATLDERTYVSGLAEVIKYGVIEDASFFDWLQRNASQLVERDANAVRHAIATSCQIKANVVADDERELTQRRAILNYGHTFAHAIEATAGYGAWLHGEAVAIGMQMAARLAMSMGLMDRAPAQRQTGLIEACKLPTTWPDANPTAMIEAMRTDKKVANSKLRFVLPNRIGQVELITCSDPAAITQAILGL